MPTIKLSAFSAIYPTAFLALLKTFARLVLMAMLLIITILVPSTAQYLLTAISAQHQTYADNACPHSIRPQSYPSPAVASNALTLTVWPAPAISSAGHAMELNTRLLLIILSVLSALLTA